MTRLNAFAGRLPVATYFGLTFVISWGGALLAIGVRLQEEFLRLVEHSSTTEFLSLRAEETR